MRKFAMLSSLALTLGACSGLVSSPQPEASRQILGKLTLGLEPTGLISQSLKSQAILPANSLTFSQLTYSSLDVSGVRYLSATYKIINNTNTAYPNVSLFAYSNSSDGTAGTAFGTVRSSTGATLTNAGVLQRILPSNGFITSAQDVQTDPNKADFQVFRAAESGEVQTASGSVAGETVLEYGFVARSVDLSSRIIPANGEGRVTVGWRVPISDAAGTPYRFQMRFIVSSEGVNRVTRGREENSQQAATRAQSLGASELLLVGPDDETASCGTGCTPAILPNAKIATLPATGGTNLYKDPSSIGVTSTLVRGGLQNPWDMKFDSSGKLLFTSRNVNKVRLTRMDVNSPTTLEPFNAPDSSTTVRGDGEGGVLGFTFDPAFSSNNKVYICYSYFAGGVVSDTNRRNRLSSFVLGSGSLNSEATLIDDIPGWSNHNGCRVVYGPDGKLYVSMGESPGLFTGAEKAQELSSMGGKILRINLDGTIPSDNPFVSSTAAEKRIWTLGHRNPQGLAFRPRNNQLWSTEHGPDVRDELNLIEAGKNYGWPKCTGISTTCTGISTATSTYKPAVRQYEPDGISPTVAMSDMAFYSHPLVPEWRDNLFFVTLKTGRLYRVKLNEAGVWQSDQILIDGFIDGSNGSKIRLRDVEAGPDGNLYVSTDEGSGSRIFRVRPNL